MSQNFSSSSITFNERKVIIVALAIQIAFLGALGLDWLGLEVPILREALGFIYLIFIPGMLLLRLLNMKEIGIIEWLLYAIGLSIALVIIIGLFINSIFPLFGIEHPISKIPLTTTISIIALVFCFLLYRKRTSTLITVNLDSHLSYKTLYLLILPFLSIIGAYLTHFYNNNFFLLLLLMIIAMKPTFVAFDKIPKGLFPITIFIISISLLYHTSLSTPYIFGRDINQEFYQAHLVLANSHLNFTQGYNLKVNSLLGDVIIGPIFSLILGIGLSGVFKVVYPFLFSLVPLGLYYAFKKQTTEKIAFFSCFLFVSYFFYFTASLQNIKHIMATFFLTFLLLLMVNNSMDKIKKSFLAIFFSLGLITSHYGVPFIFLFSALIVFALSSLSKRLRIIRKSLDVPSLTTLNFVFFFTVFSIAWFMFTGEGSGFGTFMSALNRAIQGITELFSPMEKGGVYYALGGKETYMIEYQMMRILYFISQFFIVIGFLTLFYRKLNGKRLGYQIQDEFFLYSTIFLGYLAASIVIPSIIGTGGAALGTVRLYQLALLFLSPLCPIGVIKISNRIKKSDIESVSNSKAFKFLGIFLLFFFLLNSKFVMEVHREILPDDDGYTVSVSLSQPRIKEGKGTQEELAGLYKAIYHKCDVIGAGWLGKHKNEGQKVILDFSGVLTSYGLTVPAPKIIEASHTLRPYYKSLGEDSYVFLRKVNYVDGVIVGGKRKWWSTSVILSNLKSEKNKIYSNGGSVVYK